MTPLEGELRYVRLHTTPAEELALDNAIIARGLDYHAWVGALDPRSELYDVARLRDALPAFEALALELLGRAPTRVIRVETVVPFDWSAFDGIATMNACLAGLPGALPSPREWRFFGDSSSPPYLWASFEPPGLHLAGLLDAPDWHAWWEAFEGATASLPKRRLGA
jgi:hypothetical protein